MWMYFISFFIIKCLYCFRELLLNQNYLRVLPYELGKLFQLQVLGLQGNPLSKDVLTLYGTGEPAGTNKLLTYMLDNLQGKWKNFICWEKRVIKDIRIHFFSQKIICIFSARELIYCLFISIIKFITYVLKYLCWESKRQRIIKN